MVIPVGNPGGIFAEDADDSRNAIPVVAKYTASISQPEQRRLEKIARRLAADEPALVSTSLFGPEVTSGLMNGPALLIGDSREIALADPHGSELYEYRIAALAADGDMMLISGNRNTAFERYRNDVLGLGILDIVALPADRDDGHVPLATRCVSRTRVIDAIAAKARKAKGLTILPYIGTDSAWVLAGAISERAGTSVRVAAPSPRLTHRVNDKVWFARRVEEVFGSYAQPAFRAVFGPAALAGQVARLAQQADQVVVKVPDSAGSVGNVSLGATDIQGRSPAELRTYLLSALGSIGWRGRFPLLVEIWDSPVLASPSVQIWIPKRVQGPPILEGIYEQVVSGREGKFVGSVPAALPDSWTKQLAHEAFMLATLFQNLGYFGRCSFDAVLAGSRFANAVLHWVECNGRWGGVSIPMTLANRLAKNRRRGVFVVVQMSGMSFKPHKMAEAQKMMGDDLFRVPDAESGIVFLSPVGLEGGYGVNLMAIANTVETAKMLAQRATDKLVGQAV